MTGPASSLDFSSWLSSRFSSPDSHFLIQMLSLTSDTCYLCAAEAKIQSLDASFLVDCPRCGSYEIDAVATTIELKDIKSILAYLVKERKTGSIRPFIFRELIRQ